MMKNDDWIKRRREKLNAAYQERTALRRAEREAAARERHVERPERADMINETSED